MAHSRYNSQGYEPEAKRPPLKDRDLIPTNDVEAASMGLLSISEGHVRYYKSHPNRNYDQNRWTPVLRIRMVDEVVIRWASKVMGGTHVTFDKSVGAWYTESTGKRALAVLSRIRPYIFGEKAAIIDCIIANGDYIVSQERPCIDCESKSMAEKRIEDLKRRGLLK